MTSLQRSSGGPLILSHRGRTRLADPRPDNSEAALAAAFEAGADGAEVDVRMTRDGAAVLVHDRLVRTGAPLTGLSRAELEGLLGRPVAELATVLDRWPDRIWNVELKSTDALRAVVEILAPRSDRRLLVTSFLHDLARAVGEAADVPFGYLVGHRPLDVPAMALRAAQEGATTLVVHAEHLDASVAKAAGEAGLATWVYGLLLPAEHDAAIALGVHALIADELATALHARR